MKQATSYQHHLRPTISLQFQQIDPIDFMCYGSQTPLAALEYWSRVMVFLFYCYCSYGEIKIDLVLLRFRYLVLGSFHPVLQWRTQSALSEEVSRLSICHHLDRIYNKVSQSNVIIIYFSGNSDLLLCSSPMQNLK